MAVAKFTYMTGTCCAHGCTLSFGSLLSSFSRRVSSILLGHLIGCLLSFLFGDGFTDAITISFRAYIHVHELHVCTPLRYIGYASRALYNLWSCGKGFDTRR
eukprot:2986542-Amphidinium_carterae.2